ncbi:MAG: hypothetical protein K6F86_08820 [Lachnospiraceae bacterium]|nr:hypothetical protein [Lachnospiraceae bacterium]
MKAAVMSIEGNKACIINDEGIISYIDDKGYSVGEELEIEVKAQPVSEKIMVFAKKNMPVIAAAAAFVIMLSGGVGYANCHTYSTVTLDINPSLRYSLNLFDKVIDVDAYNNDGEEIVSKIEKNAKGKNLDNVVSLTLDELDRTGYVREDTSIVVTLGSRVDSEDKLENEVVDSVSKWNDVKVSEGEAKSINVETVRVTPQMADMAIEKGVSPGKIYIVGKLKEQVLEDAEFDEDEWLTKSVNEITEAKNTVSDQSQKASAVSADKPAEKQTKAAEETSAGSTGSENSENPEASSEPKKKSSKKKDKDKKKTASGNESLSDDEVGETVSGDGTGGAAVSENQAVISENIIPEELIPLIQPTVSSQPEPESTAVPEQTETGISDDVEVPLMDQSGPTSSYLDGSVIQDTTCDSIPGESE